MTQTNLADERSKSPEEEERYYLLYADSIDEIAGLLSGTGIEYSETKIALLSVHTKDRDAISLKATAQRLLQFVSECLSRRRVVVQIRDGDFMKNVELHGYSKDEALEMLNRVNDLFISKIDI